MKRLKFLTRYSSSTQDNFTTVYHWIYGYNFDLSLSFTDVFLNTLIFQLWNTKRWKKQKVVWPKVVLIPQNLAGIEKFLKHASFRFSYINIVQDAAGNWGLF